MSRSFKRVSGFCDSNPWAKNQANQRVRRFKGELPDGCSYKKLYERWNICDHKFLLYGNASRPQIVSDWKRDTVFGYWKDTWRLQTLREWHRSIMK